MLQSLGRLSDVLWHDAVLYAVLGIGVLFTLWSRFGQLRALTHGVQVLRGRYDKSDDPGVINHFQALSTALSATVGLGNIAGVALAISLGGPGAVFWMWVTGLVGMALKMTEVTQAMLFRNTDDPENPRGGAMWVCSRGFPALSPRLAGLGRIVGGVFCLTLLVSAITGGNMFQAWNVADISHEYFGVSKLFTGIVLTLAVGVVIVGGIRRIGDVAGRLVPFMCALYLLGGIAVVLANVEQVPALLALIVRSAFAPAEATGAFVGATAGYAFLKGMQRALFSNEAGQGSAPIAHSAARTDEPVREGIVAGLEPFIDTLCVCTITALVVLSSGAWNRGPALRFVGGPPAVTSDAQGLWQVAEAPVAPLAGSDEAVEPTAGRAVFAIAHEGHGGQRRRVAGVLAAVGEGNEEAIVARFEPFECATPPTLDGEGLHLDYKGATLTARAFDRTFSGLGLWIVPLTVWLFAFSTIVSWSYYGEQGAVYLLGTRAVLPYRLIYTLLVLVATTPLIRTEDELDVVSSFGTGVMLWANLPIMLLFGPIAMRAYRRYVDRLDAGGFAGHAAPPLSDVVEGKDAR